MVRGTHRRRLRGLAYRMLASVADAEDIVQDAWLRWHAVRGTAVDEVGAYQPRPDVAHDLSFALLRTLDSLSPLERAAFLLRDVFDVDFTTIASTCAPHARVSRPGLKTADV